MELPTGHCHCCNTAHLRTRFFFFFFFFFEVNLILNLVCTLRLCTRDTSSKNISLESEARSKSQSAVSPFCVLYIIEYGSRILFILVFLYRTEKTRRTSTKIQGSFPLLSSPLSGLSLPAVLATSRTYHAHLRKGYWTLCYQLSL